MSDSYHSKESSQQPLQSPNQLQDSDQARDCYDYFLMSQAMDSTSLATASLFPMSTPSYVSSNLAQSNNFDFSFNHYYYESQEDSYGMTRQEDEYRMTSQPEPTWQSDRIEVSRLGQASTSHSNTSSPKLEKRKRRASTTSTVSHRPQEGSKPTVDQMEKELSFLRDDCATILVMLDTLRNAFSAKSSLRRTDDRQGNRKPDMDEEKEMRTGYDDLMLQVRQLEKKVEMLEAKSRSIHLEDEEDEYSASRYPEQGSSSPPKKQKI